MRIVFGTFEKRAPGNEVGIIMIDVIDWLGTDHWKNAGRNRAKRRKKRFNFANVSVGA